MFKLDLEKAEEPEIKLPHLLDHRGARQATVQGVTRVRLDLATKPPMDVGNLLSGSSSFSKSSLNIWKFLVHMLLKATLENFEHCFANM